MEDKKWCPGPGEGSGRTGLGFNPWSAFAQAKFELITSEASYIHSLSVAVGHFLGSAELSECLGAQDKQWLFSKLPEVKSTSER